MTDRLSDERLEAVLVSVGEHLVIAAAAAAAPTADRRPGPVTRSPWIIAAAAVVLIVGAVLLIPPARTAVARHRLATEVFPNECSLETD